MAVVATVSNASMNVRVDIGTAGKAELRTVSLGTPVPTIGSGTLDENIVAIATALGPCLDAPIIRIERKVTSTLAQDV